MDSDVEPPTVATENIECEPNEVRFERSRYVVVSGLASGLGTPSVLGTRPLPGTTWGQNMPPWWSVLSKSLLDSTMTTPSCQSLSTARRMAEE